MDLEYLISILIKLRDEASPGIAKLKEEIDSLKSSQDADKVTQDLGKSTEDLGKKAQKSADQHKGHREEVEDSADAIRDADDATKKAKKGVDDLGDSHSVSAGKIDEATKSLSNFGIAQDEVKGKSKDTSDGLDDLDAKMKSLIARRDELNQRKIAPDDVKALNEQREAYSDLEKQVKSTATQFSRFATAREEGEEGLKSDAIKKAEQGLVEARRLHDQADALLKLTPASRPPIAVDTAAQVAARKADEDAANAQRELETRVSSTSVAYDDFNKKVSEGTLSEAETSRGYRDFSSILSSLSREFDSGSEDALKWGTAADEAGKKAKNAFSESGGIIGAVKRGNYAEGIEGLGNKFDDLGLRITGVSSFLRGFFDLAKIGFSQQLITGIASLAGSLVSVASAAAQAGAALAGAFISGLGQAIPMISIVAAAAERFKSILQAVSITNQAEEQKYYDPNEKQVAQLQNTSQLISSQQQLSNSYIQLYEAQQRVRDSQIALTEARYTASRQLKELTLDEKDARLEAEGASLSLAEARRQLQIDIRSGDTASLAQAELAVKEAEVSKEKAQYAVPKAERERRLAQQRGVAGEPAVISAVEGLEGSKVAVAQAKQAGEAAERQEQITRLQQASRSSHETSQESQLSFLKKGMSKTELGLYNALVEIEKELKSPDSPLKKITNYFVEPFTNAVQRIRGLLKDNSFLGPIDELAESMGKGLGRLEKATYGKEGTSFFEQMAKDASKNIPVVVGSIEGLMKLFEDIAKAADPAFHKLSEDWDNFWKSIDKKYEGSGLKSLEEFFNRSVKFAEGFAHLGTSLAGLFMAIGHDAAPQGLDTVNSFTGAVEKATQWVQSHGPEVTNFFKEAREGLKVLGELLFSVGKELIEVFSLTSLKAFSLFLQQVVIPAAKNVVEVLGFLTKVLLEIANAIPGGKAVLEGLAGAFLGLEVLGKAAGPITKTVSAIKALNKAFIVLKDTGSVRAAWEAMINVFKGVESSAGGAAANTRALRDAEATSVGPAEADAAAQSGVAASEGAEGAGGIAGLAGGAAGLASKAFLPAAAIAALVATREGGQQTGPSGLLTGNESEFGGKLSRYSGKELGDLGSFNIGGFVSGLVGTSNDETKSEEKLRKFGNEVEKLKGHLSEIPKNKLEEIQKEAENLSNNSGLEKFKGALNNVAKAFNPSEIAAKKWSEDIKEYMEKLNPAAQNVAKSFESINVSTGSIWKNIKGVVKENIEDIKENLGLNSRQGKEALAANFGEAVLKIEESMKAGGTTTQIGMERIKKLVSEALSKYGVKPDEITGGSSGNVAAGVSKIAGAAANAVPKLAAGAYVPARSGGIHANIAEAGHDEAVLSTDPAHASRSRTILGQYLRAAPHMAKGGAVGEFNKSYGGTHLDRLLMAIDKVSNAGFPYKLGGGHENPARFEPFDCSGAISWVDQQAGYKVPTTVSGDIGQWGYPAGEGLATIFYNPVHTFMKVAGRYFGTSGFARKKSKGGAGWFEEDPNSSYLSGFSSVHLPDVEGTGTWTSSAKILENFGQQLTDKGVGGTARAFSSAVASAAGNVKGAIAESPAFQELIAPKIKGGGAIGQVSQAALNLATKAANIYLAKQIGSGSEPFTGGSLSGSNVGQEVMNFFTSNHLSKIAAAGITGNFEQESDLDPNAAGGGLDQGIGARNFSNRPLSGQLMGILGELEGDEKGTLEALRGAKSPAEAARIFSERFERPGIPDIGNREHYAEEAFSKYAAGGMVGDSVRRLAVRHLRKKVLKFAQGGRAPWGGAPVPIIAHEGERIMNPAQYHETARLAGTSPSGLDNHLGYNSSPRQSFADGGIPTIASSHAQSSTGSPAGFSPGSFPEFNFAANEVGSVSLFLKIFKVLKKGFKQLGTLKNQPEQYINETYKFIENITNETSGVLAQLLKGREYLKSALARKVVTKSYDVTGKSVSLKSGGEPEIEARNLAALNTEAAYIGKEARVINESAKAIKSKFKAADKLTGTKRTTALNHLNNEYNILKEKQKELGEAISANTEARYQAETQKIQDEVTQLNDAYQTVSQELTSSATTATSMGNLGAVGGIEVQIRQAAEKQIGALQSKLSSAEATGDTELVASIKQEMTSLRETINNSVVEQLNAAQTLIQRENQQVATGLGVSQTRAQTFGNLAELPGIDEAIANNAKNGISELQKLLVESENDHDTAKSVEIKEAIAGLEDTVISATAAKINDSLSLIQREAGLSESKTSMLASLSKTASARGEFGRAGSLEKESLENKQESLLTSRAAEEQLKAQAAQEGDTSAVITLTEELNKNTAELEENKLALKENIVVTRELVVNQIEATGQFKTGIYKSAITGLETVGKITGFTNVKGLLEAAKGESTALGSERSGLSGQAKGLGLNVEGMTPAQILSYLASPEGQAKLSELEKGEDKGEKEQMYKLVDALESNASATLQNTQKIAELNGQLNQPQSWSTAAQAAFRQSFFNGMGNLMPSYAAALPAGARPMEMPSYGYQAPGAASGPTIGNLSLTHPVEKLDPSLLGEELQHAISTTPSM